MSQPNPEQFAKVLLYHLAGVRAEISAIEARLGALQAHLIGPESEAVRQEWAARVKAQQDRLYLEACEEAGLQTTSPPPSPPTGGVDN